MRKFLLAAVAVVAVSVSASAHAEPKRDILGFHPGMSYQEGMSAMAKVCKGKIESLFNTRPRTPDYGRQVVPCPLLSGRASGPLIAL